MNQYNIDLVLCLAVTMKSSSGVLAVLLCIGVSCALGDEFTSGLSGMMPVSGGYSGYNTYNSGYGLKAAAVPVQKTLVSSQTVVRTPYAHAYQAPIYAPMPPMAWQQNGGLFGLGAETEKKVLCKYACSTISVMQFW